MNNYIIFIGKYTLVFEMIDILLQVLDPTVEAMELTDENI